MNKTIYLSLLTAACLAADDHDDHDHDDGHGHGHAHGPTTDLHILTDANYDMHLEYF